MKAVVAAFNQEKALVGAISVITNLRMDLFEALGNILNGGTTDNTYCKLPSDTRHCDVATTLPAMVTTTLLFLVTGSIGMLSTYLGVAWLVAGGGRCVSICLVAICGMSAWGDNKPIPGRISVICQVSSLLLQSAVSWPDRDVRPDMTAPCVVTGNLGTNIQSAPCRY